VVVVMSQRFRSCCHCVLMVCWLQHEAAGESRMYCRYRTWGRPGVRVVGGGRVGGERAGAMEGLEKGGHAKEASAQSQQGMVAGIAAARSLCCCFSCHVVAMLAVLAGAHHGSRSFQQEGNVQVGDHPAAPWRGGGECCSPCVRGCVAVGVSCCSGPGLVMVHGASVRLDPSDGHRSLCWHIRPTNPTSAIVGDGPTLLLYCSGIHRAPVRLQRPGWALYAVVVSTHTHHYKQKPMQTPLPLPLPRYTRSPPPLQPHHHHHHTHRMSYQLLLCGSAIHPPVCTHTSINPNTTPLSFSAAAAAAAAPPAGCVWCCMTASSPWLLVQAVRWRHQQAGGPWCSQAHQPQPQQQQVGLRDAASQGLGFKA